MICCNDLGAMPPLSCRSIGVTAIAVAFGIALPATCKPFPTAGKVPIAAFWTNGLDAAKDKPPVTAPVFAPIAPDNASRNKFAAPSAPPVPPP